MPYYDEDAHEWKNFGTQPVPFEQAHFELFFPPPWNMSEHSEKTEGWIEFQRAMRKDPQYYLEGINAQSKSQEAP